MKNMNKRKLLLLAAVAVMLLAGVGGTVAYLVAQTDPVVNTFEATHVEISVDDGVVTNNGSIDAYVRAAVVVTWQDANGNVHAQMPNYTVNAGSGWDQQSDGFYYYENPLSPEDSTSKLTVNCGETGPDGYVLAVEILAQGIQAEPADVVTTAWGYTPPTEETEGGE